MPELAIPPSNVRAACCSRAYQQDVHCTIEVLPHLSPRLALVSSVLPAKPSNAIKASAHGSWHLTPTFCFNVPAAGHLRWRRPYTEAHQARTLRDSAITGGAFLSSWVLLRRYAARHPTNQRSHTRGAPNHVPRLHYGFHIAVRGEPVDRHNPARGTKGAEAVDRHAGAR